MIWQQIIYYVVTLILSIALSPRPQKPKSAAIDDFEFPTAEEGRPIPVVFGEVDITGPNVLWYGDLRVRPIKKRSGFSKATVGYKYYIGFHLGLAHGEADSITRIAWDNKEVWSGNITGNASGSIDLPDIFGGSGRGGGVVGDFDIAMGGDSQTANAYLTEAVATTSPADEVPAFRGIVSLYWKAGYIGNSEYVKPIAVRMKRILKGWEGTVWYSSRATVDGGMNPVHVLYQCLTDTRWGMGVAVTRINDSNFRAMADLLFSENFGLHIIWAQSSTIEQFIQIVLDHIGGGLSLRLDSGLFELTLFRGNYDIDDLIEYDQADIINLTKYEKQALGDTVNEVTLTYTDPATRNPTTITAQDLASVESQGARIPAPVELKGIRNHAIAREVLGRELAQRTMPLTKITFTINRRAWHVGFGDLFRFTWPERQCYGKVFRVLKISKGTLQENEITVEALEDIYQYSLGTGLAHQSGSPLPAEPETPPDDDDSGANVISASQTAPPGAPVDGARYIVPPGASGAWAGHSGQLAEWDADEEAWVFTDIPDGTLVYVEDTNETIQIIDDEQQPAPWGLVRIRTHDSSDSTTVGVADCGGCVEMDRAGANTITLPNDSNADIPVNATGLIRQIGAGQTTIVADSGVTIRSPGSLVIRVQYGGVAWHKRGANDYHIEGNVEP